MAQIDMELGKALECAYQEASRRSVDYLDSAMLLLGIMSTSHSVSQIFSSHGVNIENLRRGAFSQPRPRQLYSFTSSAGRIQTHLSAEVVSSFSKASGLVSEQGLPSIDVLTFLLAMVSTDNSLKELLRQSGVRNIDALLAALEKAQEAALAPPAPVDRTNEETVENEGEEEGSNSSSRKKKEPTLRKYTVDLTALAREGKLSPLIGRDAEIQKIAEILGRKTKNNPILIGEAGVGKTTVAEGLAQRVVEGKVPARLKGKRVLRLDLSTMVAGSRAQGDFEERIINLLKEVKQAGDVVLFLDEIHTLLGAGGGSDTTNAANILKPALARGEIATIGATTPAEYRKYMENKDVALSRRFRPVWLTPPSPEDTVLILQGLKDSYEEHHGVYISDEAIVQAVELADRYIGDRFQPDKSIDLIDEASSRLAIQAEAAQGEEHTQGEEQAQEEQSSAGVAGGPVPEPPPQEEQKQENEREKRERPVLTAEHVALVLSGNTGIPLARLTEDESERLAKLEEILHRRLIGQSDAVSTVARAIRRGRVGLKDPNRPLGAFLFLGPTGVGKTELAKAMQEFLTENEQDMVRLDMSEYMEAHTISTLVGSPPGYVGYGDGGKLTEAVRKRPYCVVLFDEIEKAHPDVYNLLLQILEEGRLTDRQGSTVDFRNTAIIMTSNIGAAMLTAAESVDAVLEDVLTEVRHHFRPEFINRLDETICFHQLSYHQVGEILHLMVKKVEARLAKRNVRLQLQDSAVEFLLEKGFDRRYGARPLRRALSRYLEDALTDALLSGTIRNGQTILISRGEEGLAFSPL